MPDKKLTDNEIKKALKQCQTSNLQKDCEGCPYDDEVDCLGYMFDDALDLINRLQAEKQILEIELKAMRGAANSYKAENEGLEEKLNRSQDRYFGISNLAHKYRNKVKTAKAEAYKECIERLNKEAEKVEIDREGDFLEADNKIYDTVADWCKETSDNLLNELVGDNNG